MSKYSTTPSPQNKPQPGLKTKDFEISGNINSKTNKIESFGVTVKGKRKLIKVNGSKLLKAWRETDSQFDYIARKK